ncbi:MAG TPA: hypothetical protein VLV45_03350 [Gemmatimonadales bacterium]|nr:hypothetical protein [Gemmatimonadales bacterium]
MERRLQLTFSEADAFAVYAGLRAFQLLVNYAYPEPLLEVLRAGAREQGVAPLEAEQAADEFHLRMRFLCMDNAETSPRLTTIERTLNQIAAWLRAGQEAQ